MWGSRRSRGPAGDEALVDEVDAAPPTAPRRRFRRPPRTVASEGRLLNPSVDLVGAVVTQLRFDYGLTIALGDDVSLRIETAFEHTAAADAEPVVLDPEHDLGRMGPLLLLHRTAVTDFSADTSGDLAIAFSDGSALRCLPDERFEAWKLSFADGRLYVCQPGGDVTVWAGGGDLWADGDD